MSSPFSVLIFRSRVAFLFNPWRTDRRHDRMICVALLKGHGNDVEQSRYPSGTAGVC